MNILFRHTLGSISRNPVQSVIVVVSTAMITACVLICLCISSMFEQISSGWINMNFAGASLLVNTSDLEPAEEYLESYSDIIVGTIYSQKKSETVISATDSVRVNIITTDDLANFDRLTEAEMLSDCTNATDYPAAHISKAFSEAANVGLGDIFSVTSGQTYVVTAICNNTGRYFDQLVVVCVCEPAPDVPFKPGNLGVYLKDREATDETGAYIADRMAEDLNVIYDKETCAQSNADYTDALTDDSVEGSMKMMTVACVAITLIMACLLYASFSVIVRGRVNELVKFKAAGATPAQSALILLTEASFYALIGGLVGLGVGKGLISYLDTLLGEIAVGAAIVTEAYKYPLAFIIGALCGIAACILPALRMSTKSVRRLLGGDERLTRAVPWWVALIITVATGAMAVAMFLVPNEVLIPVSVIFIAFTLVWVITVIPHLLKMGCAFSRLVTRPGAGYVSECAAPRNNSVNATLTMLAALIAFITLGTSIIEIVNYTTISASDRFGGDFIVTVDRPSGKTDPVTYGTDVLNECLKADGVTEGYLTVTCGSLEVTPLDYDTEPEKVSLVDYTVTDANALRYLSKNIDDETIRRFAQTEHPVILPVALVNKYGYEIGDTVVLWIKTSEGVFRIDNDFTLVGVDNTITSWDNCIFTRTESVTLDGELRYSDIILRLSGDSGKFVSIRDAVDSDAVSIFKRDGYFPAEGGDKLDSSRLISIFTTIVYSIAAMGLVNLIVITAGERRREFDVLRLCGMTFRDAVRYIVTETAVLSFIGFVSGLVFAILTNYSSKGIALIIDKYIVPDIFPLRILFIAAAATGIFIVLWALSHVITFAQISSDKYRRREDRLLRSD